MAIELGLNWTGRALFSNPQGEDGGLTETVRIAEDPGSGAALRTNHDLEVHRRTIRRAMHIGIWVWPFFTLLDVYMALVLYPGAPLAQFVVYRIAVEALMVVVHRATGQPGLSVNTLASLQNGSFFCAALCIALMAVHLGGIRSPYMHGISIVFLVRAALIPEPWQRSLASFAPIVMVFPLVIAASAILLPEVGDNWFTANALARFVGDYVFVVASSVVGLASSHAVWAAQQQVYRARRLGRYRLQAPIGHGGMGEVWLAWDESLRRNLALKLLRVAERSDRESVRRFEREARAASQLRVPHTIHIYDFGASDDGVYYFAMEYLTGVNLHTLVRTEGPLPPVRAVRFAIQACLSLEEAHAAGIIHRDIKPQNLFVTRVGQDQDFLKLLDFGIARIRESEGNAWATRSGLLAGTPAFIAPELWLGAGADERSDIYALGATLYFMLTGTAPFLGEDLEDLRHAHLEQSPPRPSEHAEGVFPGGLDEIVLRCLAKAPDQRYASIGELRGDLTRVMRRSRGVSADFAEAQPPAKTGRKPAAARIRAASSLLSP